MDAEVVVLHQLDWRAVHGSFRVKNFMLKLMATETMTMMAKL